MIYYVAGLLFSEDRQRVALILKDHVPAAVVGKWNAIGGKRGAMPGALPYEPSDVAMRREFQEEAGVVVPDWCQFLNLVGKDWEVAFFHAFDDRALAGVRTMENEEVRNWGVDDVLGHGLWNVPVVPNLRWIVPMALGHVDEHVGLYCVDEVWRSL